MNVRENIIIVHIFVIILMDHIFVLVEMGIIILEMENYPVYYKLKGRRLNNSITRPLVVITMW